MGLENAFAMAQQISCDGLEIMVSSDLDTQSTEVISQLAHKYAMPVAAIHHPCLLSTAQVWGSDPSKKLAQSVELAAAVGASTVVTHPTFVWQRDFAKNLLSQIEELNGSNSVQIALENMYPLRLGSREISSFLPSWDVQQMPTQHVVLDTSHASVARQDILEQWHTLSSRIRHLHLSDATGRSVDEHLLPGKGSLPLKELLGLVAAHPTPIDVVLEVNTSAQRTPESRLRSLQEAVEYVRAGLDPNA